MISECRRVGIPDPEFHTDGNSVWVVFRYTRKAVGSYPTVTPQSPDSYPTVTPQVGKVLSAIGNQTLSTKDVMEMIGLKDKSNFLVALSVSCNKVGFSRTDLSGKAETPATEIPSYGERSGFN